MGAIKEMLINSQDEYDNDWIINMMNDLDASEWEWHAITHATKGRYNK